MPTVPWIRLYQGWQRHRKTIALRRILGTAEPILCLWLWAAENAPDGCMEGMSDDEIERLSEWTGKKGKAITAMLDVGYLERSEGGALMFHNWEKRTGAGVKSLIKTRERQREMMRSRRANDNASVSGAVIDHVIANKNDNQGNNPLTLSLSGSDSSPDPEGSRRPPMSANISSSCQGELQLSTRSGFTGNKLRHMFGRLRIEILGIQCAPGAETPPDNNGKASAFAERMTAAEAVDVERTMRRFLEHLRDRDDGWTADPNNASLSFGSWRDRFNDLRVELAGRPAPTQQKQYGRKQQNSWMPPEI